MAYLSQKVSVSLPSNLIGFVKEYKGEYHLKSDSEVIAVALRMLENTHLAACYAESGKEMNKDLSLKEELDLWDKTVGDGLENEDW